MIPEIWSMTDKCFSHFGPFLALLHPFPLTSQRMKILKKWEKYLGISSFYTSVHKAMCGWSFIHSNPAHQKIKALFYCISLDCYEKFYVKLFFFLSFCLSSIEKGKSTLNPIVLQNLFQHLFNYSIVMYLMKFINFGFIFIFFLLHCKKMHALNVGYF